MLDEMAAPQEPGGTGGLLDKVNEIFLLCLPLIQLSFWTNEPAIHVALTGVILFFLEGKELPTVIKKQPKDFNCGRHNPTFMELLLRMIVGENIAENLFSKLLMSYDLF